MKFVQTLIQRLLSNLTGAQATFEQFTVSPFKGLIDIGGLSLRHPDHPDPVVTVGRVRANVALGRLARGELVIPSLTIEQPSVSIVRYADGQTNLPRPPGRTERVRKDRPEGSEERADDTGELPARVRIESGGKVLVIDGQVTYRSECPEDGGYHLSAGPILAELAQQDENLTFTLIVESIARTDRPRPVGQLKMTGHFTGAADPTRLGESPLQAECTLGHELHVKVESPGINRRQVHVEMHGRSELAALLALLPPGLVPARVAAMEQLTGRADLSLQLRYGPKTGLNIPSAHFQLCDLTVAFSPGTAGPSS